MGKPLSEDEINGHKKAIDAMSQEAMARLWRFAPSGHPYFDTRNGDLFEYFNSRFRGLGGFTPAISKVLG